MEISFKRVESGLSNNPILWTDIYDGNKKLQL